MIQIQVSPGDLIDKLTILEIKLERICDAQKRTNVAAEHAALWASYETHMPSSPTLATLTEELRQVNLRLWTIEDDLRDC
jgi:hypothetical protein